MTKPEPVHKGATCSVCGLDWDRHGKAPTIEKCVELLKADLAARPMQPWPHPTPVMPHPYPWRPLTYPWRPPTYPTVTYSGNTTSYAA